MTLRKTTIALFISTVLISGCSDKPATSQQTNESQQPTVSTEVKEVTAQEAHQTQIQSQTTKSVPASQPEVFYAVAPTNKRAMIGMPSHDMIVVQPNRDNYLPTPSNGVQLVSEQPLSTFSIDVDTGSYANIRSYLDMGQKPPADAIREEAFINYFDYGYEVPTSTTQPFSVQTELAPSPWNEDRQLLRVALKGYDIPSDERKPSNLVFLVDVSGSMGQPNKLPLLVQSLSMLTKQLSGDDTVSLVTYAGTSSVVLKPTQGDNQQDILNALKQLQAGGGTYGESGIKLAYQQAKSGFIKNGVNRVILATDGDFNVGVTNLDQLKNMIKTERDNGISLTTLGFGRGNYNDAMMEQLADIGDGNHAYIDTLHEAQKVLIRQMSGTLQSIASDVKIQIEFNPAVVKEYRLIGYQNRQLRDEDFNNDKVDAGEIGAGHSVTAIYEITYAGDKGQIDDLRYQSKPIKQTKTALLQNEVAQVKVRYKLPEADTSKLVKTIVHRKDGKPAFTQASSDFQFATSVAAFAQKLKDNQYLDDLSYEQIASIARNNRGDDPYNDRGEFIRMVEVAQSL
ncbi:VWA domain-containing protein [Enterovibrio sp. ZSDZ35]|uniref:VWA domain-containing protein n=1 Tax=Enterovibrio qingdaonensis TaxID=2899818 RepID=A0ABT5QTG4_9GAMM|nr:VWA domain-containing protein [Enterovibrio sp. ZSDZ35]MDD1784268.1 VWA domain-containing protein [Enterovibrio sp. ZSDZ35]